jgi:hypothetical protein
MVVRTRLNVTFDVQCLSCYLQLQHQFLDAKTFVEKATAAQVVTKFSFYGNWTFINVFTKGRHLPSGLV